MRRTRERGEGALHGAEARLDVALRDLPGYAWIKALNGRYLYLNHNLQAVLPKYSNDWRGKMDNDLWPVEMASEHRKNDEQVIRTAAPLHTIETWIHHGQTRYLLVSKFPILNRAGVPILVAGASIDVTDRSWVQRELEEALARLQRLAVRTRENSVRERVRITHNEENELRRAFATVTKQLHLLAQKLSPADESATTHRDDQLPSKSRQRSQVLLTRRELDVLQLLATGLRNKEIAAQLAIGKQTTQTHVKSIFTKLRVHDRTAAVAAAVRQGIIYLG